MKENSGEKKIYGVENTELVLTEIIENTVDLSTNIICIFSVSVNILLFCKNFTHYFFLSISVSLFVCIQRCVVYNTCNCNNVRRHVCFVIFTAI